MTINGMWAIASGTAVFLALGFHGARHMAIALVLIALVMLAVTLSFEKVVFDRSPSEVFRMPLELMAGSATSIGAAVGLVAAAAMNQVIGLLKGRRRE